MNWQEGLEPCGSGADVYRDVVYLYTNILMDYPEGESVELATRVILDSKHFVKEWPFRDEADQLLRFICRVMPGLSVLKTELTKELPPSELIIVPLHAILGELNQKWIFHQEN